MSGFHESTCISAPFCECAEKRIAALEAALGRSDAVDLAETGRHIRDAALEEAATVAESFEGECDPHTDFSGHFVNGVTEDTAEAIRALKSTPPPRLYSVEEVERAMRAAGRIPEPGSEWAEAFRAALKGKAP